mmetsp:Transcript_36411/g.97292  ORF Transcript_36411/g.97292 Transcript_36411/m.97292 type:complete len:755 (-) Transcript_36411:467-2731(-)
MSSLLCVPERGACEEPSDAAMNHNEQSPFDPSPTASASKVLKGQARRDLQTQIDDLKSAIAAAGIDLPAAPKTAANDNEMALDLDDVYDDEYDCLGPTLPLGLVEVSKQDQQSDLTVYKEEEDAEDDEKTEEVELTASMWDMPLIMFTPPIGSASSMVLLLLLILNATIQLVFLWIIVDGLSNPQFNSETVDELMAWRRTTAHDYSNYDPALGKSLARRVCDGDASLATSGVQIDSYANLVAYIGEENGDDVNAIGPLMCTLGLLIWLLTVSKEFNGLWKLVLGVATIPRGTSTTIVFDEDDSKLQIECLSTRRTAATLLVALARAFICGTLAAYGCLFLAYEISLGDLLLNTVALEFVLSVDELIFEALVPTTVKQLVESAAPLAAVRARALDGPRWRGLDTRAALTIGTVATMLGAVLGLILLPQRNLLVQARDALCAGDRDFVFTLDGLGSIAWTYPEGTNEAKLYSRNYPDGGDPKRRRPSLKSQPLYTDGVIDTVLAQQGRKYHASLCSTEECFDTTLLVPTPLADRPPCCKAISTRVPVSRGARLSVEQKAAESVSDAVQLWNPSCYDALDAGGYYKNLLQGAFADAANEPGGCGASREPCPMETPFCSDSGECVAPACANAEVFCRNNTLAGLRARQLCPVTCGCDDPRSALALSLPEAGCGAQCLRVGTYRERMDAMPCEDVPTDDAGFQNAMSDMLAVAQTWPYDWKTSSTLIFQDLQQYGCQYLQMNQTGRTFFLAVPLFCSAP